MLKLSVNEPGFLSHLTIIVPKTPLEPLTGGDRHTLSGERDLGTNGTWQETCVFRESPPVFVRFPHWTFVEVGPLPFVTRSAANVAERSDALPVTHGARPEKARSPKGGPFLPKLPCRRHVLQENR